MSKELTTGDLVLCKVGSFAPWPAVVFPQSILRKDVYRRRKPECVAVCFFNDETYYWDKPTRLKRLTKSAIDEFLDNAPSSEDPGLVGAYEEARNYTSLHEFIMQRLEEEGRVQEWEESEMAGSTIEAGQDPFVGKASTKLSTKAKDSGRPRIGQARERRSTGNDSSSGTGPGSLKSRTATNSPSSTKKLSRLDHAKRVEISLLFRCKLQRNLVQRDTPPGAEEIKESHKLLSKIADNTIANPQFFDIEALRQSKLHKLASQGNYK